MLLYAISLILGDIRSLIMTLGGILFVIFVIALIFEWPTIALFSFIGGSIAMAYDEAKMVISHAEVIQL